MNRTLKPCPFCGGTNLFIGSAAEIDQDDHLYADDNYTVCCDSTKGGCGATCGYQPTTEEAIEAWNRRANNDKTD